MIVTCIGAGCLISKFRVTTMLRPFVSTLLRNWEISGERNWPEDVQGPLLKIRTDYMLGLLPVRDVSLFCWWKFQKDMVKKSPPLVANKWYPYSLNRSAGNESLICPLPRYSFDAHFKDKAENKRPLTSMFFRMPGKSEKVWVS